MERLDLEGPLGKRRSEPCTANPSGLRGTAGTATGVNSGYTRRGPVYDGTLFVLEFSFELFAAAVATALRLRTVRRGPVRGVRGGPKTFVGSGEGAMARRLAFNAAKPLVELRFLDAVPTPVKAVVPAATVFRKMGTLEDIVL